VAERFLFMTFVAVATLFSLALALPTEDAKASSSHWQLLSSFHREPDVVVTKHRSSKTGLTVVVGRAASPIDNGYICLATEAWTDDGLPHVLEHLIFLGR